MAARLPLKTILRDIFMMLCGSLIGLLLARGFVTHSLGASDVSEICGTLQMAKKLERSWNREGSGVTTTHGATDKSGWSLEAEPLGSGDEATGWTWEKASHYHDNHRDRSKGHQDVAASWNRQDMTYEDQDTAQGRGVSKLLVGVVTEEKNLPRTINSVMETWGQGSNNMLFYSVPGKSEEGGEYEDELWAWHGKRRSSSRKKAGGDIVRVIRVNTASHSKVDRIVPVLRHMYSVLLNQSDWFMYVPWNTYVRLSEVERLIIDLDTGQPILIGRLHKDPDRRRAGGCDEERGVVLSWQLLRLLGEALEAGTCGRGEWSCLYQHLGIQCTSSHQISQVFADAAVSHNSTLPSSHASSLFSLHQQQLLQDLEISEARVRTLRRNLAKNTRHIKDRTLV